MSARARGLRIALIAAVGGLTAACADRSPVERLPAAEETIVAIGKRLGGSFSQRELDRLVGRGDRILAALTRQERAALSRSWIRFRVDRPVVVEVAAPARSIPFWLADQGFAPTDRTLTNADGDFAVYRKEFEAGWVGLGINGLDRSPVAHYAAFVHPRSGPGPVALHDLQPARLRVVEAVEGISPYRDDDRPFDRLPGPLLGASLVQVARADRHATALLKGRPWKTNLPSGPAPDQVAISYGLDPSRSLTWTWRTDPTVRATAIRITPAADLAAVRVVRGDSRPVASDGLLNDPIIRRHRAAANDLKPDTVYAYSPGDGSPAGWAPWRSVRTGPADRRGFRFLYVGDPQCGLEAWGTLIDGAARRHPDAAFLMIAGDLVDRGNERTNWDHFFLRAAGVFDRRPVMPCAGNHEYLDKGPVLYRSTFALPGNGPEGLDPGLAYSFEYAGAIFAILDSTSAVTDPRIARLQADWLDATLSRSRASWKFVMFHHPIYASHPTREYPALRDAWGPTFDKHRVDLVLQGHDHAYLRTYPMLAGRRAEGPSRGTTYVVAVSGEKFCEQSPRDYIAKGLTNTPTYQLIDVGDDRVSYRAFDGRGSLVDELVVEHPDLGRAEAVAEAGVARE